MVKVYNPIELLINTNRVDKRQNNLFSINIDIHKANYDMNAINEPNLYSDGKLILYYKVSNLK